MNSEKEKIEKNSLIHDQNLQEKTERNLNKEKFGMGKIKDIFQEKENKCCLLFIFTS